MTSATKSQAATEAVPISAEQMRQLLIAVYADPEEAGAVSVSEALENVARWAGLDEKDEETTP